MNIKTVSSKQYRKNCYAQIVAKSDLNTNKTVYAFICLDDSTGNVYGHDNIHTWTANNTDFGINYVALWRSRSTAYRRRKNFLDDVGCDITDFHKIWV